eukprot:4781117-Amphidinium_carterae.1
MHNPGPSRTVERGSSSMGSYLEKPTSTRSQHSYKKPIVAWGARGWVALRIVYYNIGVRGACFKCKRPHQCTPKLTDKLQAALVSRRME